MPFKTCDEIHKLRKTTGIVKSFFCVFNYLFFFCTGLKCNFDEFVLCIYIYIYIRKCSGAPNWFLGCSVTVLTR